MTQSTQLLSILLLTAIFTIYLVPVDSVNWDVCSNAGYFCYGATSNGSATGVNGCIRFKTCQVLVIAHITSSGAIDWNFYARLNGDPTSPTAKLGIGSRVFFFIANKEVTIRQDGRPEGVIFVDFSFDMSNSPGCPRLISPQHSEQLCFTKAEGRAYFPQNKTNIEYDVQAKGKYFETLYTSSASGIVGARDGSFRIKFFEELLYPYLVEKQLILRRASTADKFTVEEKFIVNMAKLSSPVDIFGKVAASSGQPTKRPTIRTTTTTKRTTTTRRSTTTTRKTTTRTTTTRRPTNTATKTTRSTSTLSSSVASPMQTVPSLMTTPPSLTVQQTNQTLTTTQRGKESSFPLKTILVSAAVFDLAMIVAIIYMICNWPKAKKPIKIRLLQEQLKTNLRKTTKKR
ncbi:hypothetical protein HDE_00011 [Halotydeus destructor]|nr:hypothetical protein HDE_00011 [Halotydeus destructor]